jgi:predicted nucleic acid-binding protein
MGFPESGAEASWQIADASVWINLASTGRCAEILAALGAPIAIVDVVLRELQRGSPNGYDVLAHVEPLIQSGQVHVLSMAAEDEEEFFGLVAGGAAETLDDGEAATLVVAARLKCTALVDERKATAIAKRRFPNLDLRSTTDVLFATLPDEGGNVGPLADALYSALRGARMRVPAHWQARVIQVLGVQRASLCNSLPAHLRVPSINAADVLRS